MTTATFSWPAPDVLGHHTTSSATQKVCPKYWVELSGGTRLAVDAAPRIRAGVAPFRVSSDWVLGMAQAITDGARFPPLILVTTRTSGELVVLEGHTRLTVFMLARDRLPPELEVLAGSSPAMTGWSLW